MRRTPDEERRDVLPNWLGASAEFVTARVETKDNPRGVAVAPDGKTAWVANTLDDSLSVIDLARREAVARVDLGGPKKTTHIRWGEKLFHNANVTFQRQFACATCHPDGHVDGLTYDIEADGIGVSPVDNRTLRGIYDTDPFKWEGTNVSLARQCGARLAVFFTRIAPFTPERAAGGQRLHGDDPPAAEPAPAARHGADRGPAPGQARLRALAGERRARDPARGPVPLLPLPAATSPTGSSATWARSRPSTAQGKFDMPHLNNIYDSAPYLHNGMADTLEEIWTRFNPYDTARRHERHDQGPAQRPHRVPEDPVSERNER